MDYNTKLMIWFGLIIAGINAVMLGGVYFDLKSIKAEKERKKKMDKRREKEWQI